MAGNWKLASILVIAFAVLVTANEGDDFSNNLATDLAPILALFGERVTMQFMSQSMGWADNIILAMAPLGIITAIIGAIRVGGPSWLKTIIGRARENLAVAEVELMSSTSNEVCELWNSQEVVRCMGTAPVVEFICLVLEENRQPRNGHIQSTAKSPPRAVPWNDYLDLKEVGFKKDISQWWKHFKENLDRKWLFDSSEADLEKGPAPSSISASPTSTSPTSTPPTSTSPTYQKIVILRNKSSAAPNISLNSHNQFSRKGIRFVAFVGIIIQLCILSFHVLTARYPNTFPKETDPITDYASYYNLEAFGRYPEDKKRLPDYALPCNLLGAILLAGGMLVCAHVVESSTEEKIYEAKEKSYRTQMVWLQQRKTVNDQDFDSFAIFPKDDRRVIATSRRADTKGQQKSETSISHSEPNSGSELNPNSASDFDHFEINFEDGDVLGQNSNDNAIQERGSSKSPTTTMQPETLDKNDITTAMLVKSIITHVKLMIAHFKSSFKILEIKTVFGTIITLAGFILQFVGLRGMHWTASVFQLGAVLIMTLCRAFVRRGLAKPPGSQPITSGFELDWFALTLGDLNDATWLPKPEFEKEKWFKALKKKLYAFIKGLWQGTKQSEEEKSGDLRDVPSPPEPKIEKEKWFKASKKKLYTYIKGLSQGTNQSKVEKSEDANNVKSWSIITGKSAEDHKKLGEGIPQSEKKGSSTQSNNHKLDALAVMNVRMELGRLSEWRSQASAEAVSLARAIEITMDTLFGVNSSSQMKHNTTFWSLKVDYNGIHPITFKLERQKNGKWEASSTEMEAALSLWLYSVHNEEQKNYLVQGEQKTTLQGQYEASFRGKEKSGKQSLRLLGTYTEALHQDLQWWMPVDGSRIIQVEEDNKTDAQKTETEDRNARNFNIQDGGSLQYEHHRIVGCGDDGTKKKLLATESSVTLKSLYSQDMFSAFMWAVAKTMKNPIKGDAIIQPIASTGVEAWKSFTLRNNELSKMVQDIHNTELGSLDDIYSSIIPPLSVANRLPETKTIVDLALEKAKQHEQAQHWEQAAEIYLWLFKKASIFPEDSYFFKRATAMLMEYLRSIILGIKWRETQLYDQREIKAMEEVKSKLKESLTTATKIIPCIMGLYRKQKREWEYIQSDSTPIPVKDIDSLATLGFSELHSLAQHEESNEGKIQSALKENGENINLRDILDWTPLHYATMQRLHDTVSKLIKNQANVNAQDLVGWTPLHNACAQGDTSIVRILLREGAKPDLKCTNGAVPLHYAAKHGRNEVVTVLVEAGVALNVQDGSGQTPLHWAACKGHEEVVEILRHNTSNILRDHQGRTTLHLAAIGGSKSMVQGLVEKALADKKAKDGNGRTPLHLAALDGQMEVVQYLVENGADKEAKDDEGRTPLYVAADKRRMEVVQYLVENGADKEAKDDKGRTPLYVAADKRRMEVVQYLVENGADKEAKDDEGRTPLYVAADKRRMEVVQYLVENGADKEAKSEYGGTPLYVAALNGRMEVVQYLVENGADKEAKDEDGGTPLYVAADNGRMEVVQYLVKNGADKEAKDEYGRTPLYVAALNGRMEVVQYLVENGADKEAKSEYGRTPLYVAALNGRMEVVQYLVENGADKEAKDDGGRTPLYVAALDGQIEVVQYLVKNGADKEAKDEYGGTPLYVAADNGRMEVVQYLVENGADKEAKSEYGCTPLYVAADKRRMEVVQYLVKNGADKEAKDEDGGTPLYVAADNGRMEVVQYLVENGADKEAKDKYGGTPLYVAALNGRMEVVQYLVKNGADKEAKDKGGCRPLHLAAGNGQKEVVQYLVENGADKEAKDKDGGTPLHRAADNRRMEVVQYLEEK